MTSLTMRCLSLGAALPLALTLSADMTIDFDDATNPFSAGTLSTAQSVSGSSSLFIAAEELPIFNLPPELQNKDLTITMQVFDQGKWVTTDNSYGPRWGVGTSYAATDYVAVAIIDKSFLPSDAGYGYHQTAQGDPFNGQFASNTWFGPAFVSGTTRPGLSATSDDDSTGTGGWLQWQFDISSSGEVSWNRVGSSNVINDDIGGAATSIFLFGGDSSSNMAGLFVDDIVITDNTVPEPSTYALLMGAAGLLWIGLRRRR